MILHADIRGEGPPVAVLHGLFGHSRNLSAVVRGLAATHRVVALDLRNHGASGHAPGMAYPELAADVLESLAALGALPAGLLGHSMGGKAAMACALLAPDAVRGLLVADIAPLRYAHHNATIAAAMQALSLHPGLTRAQADAALAAAVPDAAVRGFLLQNLVTGAAPAWRIGLDAIAGGMADIEDWPGVFDGLRYDGPVLFVAGARSEYLGRVGRDAALAAFARARVVVLKDAGHWLHADQPDTFLSLAASFFAGMAPTGLL